MNRETRTFIVGLLVLFTGIFCVLDTVKCIVREEYILTIWTAIRLSANLYLVFFGGIKVIKTID